MILLRRLGLASEVLSLAKPLSTLEAVEGSGCSPHRVVGNIWVVVMLSGSGFLFNVVSRLLGKYS